jgi:NSS family neurotransmitter:Na+ symporter
LVENKNFSRQKACIYAGSGVWLLGVAVAFSFNLWKNVKLFDLTLFQLLDYLTANLMLPIGGFCIAIFAGWVMHTEHTQSELEMPCKPAYTTWQLLVRYVSPTAIFFVFLHVIGVL